MSHYSFNSALKSFMLDYGIRKSDIQEFLAYDKDRAEYGILRDWEYNDALSKLSYWHLPESILNKTKIKLKDGREINSIHNDSGDLEFFFPLPKQRDFYELQLVLTNNDEVELIW